MRAFVGLGEGIGNVVMGLPLVDALLREGHEVSISMRPTPPAIAEHLAYLIGEGRGDGPRFDVWWGNEPPGPFDVACLTHWWLSRGGALPRAREVFVGGAPSDIPEILANLDAARTIAPDASARAVVHLPWRSEPFVDEKLLVGIHPGCKDDPEWRRRKVYPRWAEVTHVLKDFGVRVVVIGTKADAAYCGEPDGDARGRTTLRGVTEQIADLDVLVSGDSGLHHLAVALGIPTVSLFGGSSVGKATHPDPVIAPVVFGPSATEEEFALIDPRAVARAAVNAAVRCEDAV